MKVENFPKVEKPQARTWEVPQRKIVKVLRLVDTCNDPKKDNRVTRYNLFHYLEKIIPETKGIVLQVKMCGAIPYVEEVI